MKNDAVKLFALAILAILLIITLAGCSSLDPATRYARENKYRSYIHWKQGEMTLWEKMFGESNKDLRVKQAENDLAIHENNLKIQKEQEQIKNKVEQIRSKIK